MAYKITGKVRFWFWNTTGTKRTSSSEAIDQVTAENHHDKAIQEALRAHLGERYDDLDEFEWDEGPVIQSIGEDVFLRLKQAPSLFD